MTSEYYSELESINMKNSFYKKLLYESPGLIFHLHISKTGVFSFPFLSKSICNLFDLNSVELGTDVFTVLKRRILPDDLKKFVESIKEYNDRIVIWEHDFRARIKNDDVFCFKGQATVEYEQNGCINFFGKIVELTEYKIQELKLSKDCYSFMPLTTTTEGIWDYNVKTKKLYYCSKTMKMLGFSEHYNVESTQEWENRIHPSDKLIYNMDIEAYVNNDTSYYENKKRIMTKSGTYKWILSRGKVIERDENNIPIRYIGTHTDITFQKEKEEELIKSLKIISDQNSKLLNYTYVVSHNLRSHAGNIEMLLDIIEDDIDKNSLGETIQYLRSSSNALKVAINHLKELVEVQTSSNIKREKLNVNEYLAKTFIALDTEILKKNVIIKNSISNDEFIVFNSSYFESVLFNLTSNAVKHVKEGIIPVISFSMNSTGLKKTLVIEDNGVGVNLKLNGDKLCGTYKTLHSNDDSKDIGLFVTKNIIKAMGGTIEIQNMQGAGTVFKIYFYE